MKIMKCIFCQEKLDGSDEHIIPDSINGRMHSKKILCHNCNSNIFGKYVDPIVKTFFNPLLVAFRFQNARSFYIYDADGELFLHDAQGTIKKVKPKVTKSKVGNKTMLEVTGDPINVIKLFQKEAKKLEKEGKISKIAELRQLAPDGVPFKSEIVFERNDKLKVLFNKIAFEYLSYKGFDVSPYQETLTRVKNVDESINNVYFCNEHFEIRKFELKELTHLIKPIVNNNKLVVYIELFNILCGIVVIDLDFKGKMVPEPYYQDAIQGSRIEKEVILNELELNKTINADPINLTNLKLDSLLRRAFGVQQEIELQNRLEEETRKPIEILKKRLQKKEITPSEFDKRLMLIIIENMAKLSVDEFPYMFEDIPDENDNKIHYIHSNLRETQFDEFCKINQHLIGKGIIDPEDKRFIIKRFEHFPVTVKNGVSIVKVFVVVEGESGIHRIPYKDVFEMEPINEPEI
jgi:hypothetical protein